MWDVDDVCPGIAADGGDTVLGGVGWCVTTSFNWRSPEVLCVNMFGIVFGRRIEYGGSRAVA